MNPRGLFFLLCILMISVSALGAQQHNSVPLAHRAYKIIEMGVLKGIIAPPPSARPWSESTIKKYLREMLAASGTEKLSQKEMDIVSAAIASFDRYKGFSTQGEKRGTESAPAGESHSLENEVN